MKKIVLILTLIALMAVQVVSAQGRMVTGTVTSDQGETLPGVSVIVKGTTNGTVTNLDGVYSMSVENGKTLIFSYIGMGTKEIVVKSDIINVELSSSSVGVDEVMVVAYGTATKGSFTGSASVVKSELIEKRQVSNVSNALAGSVAGVQVLSSNGQPGVASTIRVRGVGSINAGSDPLYVVDGVPFDGDLSSINTSDIESMTVLKDAASTALYGARGANGIIMITTKTGSTGEANINLNVKYGMNSRAVKNYDVMSSPSKYLETTYDAIYNAGVYELEYDADAAHAYANSTISVESEGGLGYQIYTVDGDLIGTDGKLNSSATLGYSDGEYYYTPDDWSGETFQSNPRQEYDLSISGGTAENNYYVSVGYLDDSGIVPSSGFTRLSTRLKGNYRVKDWLKVGANISYNDITSDYPGEQTSTSSSGNAFYVANYIAPIYPMYVRSADTKQIVENLGRKVYDYGDGESTNFSRSFMSIANPAGDLEYNKTEYLMDIMSANAYAEFSPIEGLKVTARYGVNIDNTRYNDLGNAYMGQSAAYGGTAYQSHTRTDGFNQQYVANYQKSFDIHTLDFTAGYDGYTYEETSIFAAGQNLYNPESYYIGNAIDNLRGGGEADFYATEGYFARANYSYNDTYFGNVAFRRDASSRFSEDNRWGNFWSASAAWILTNEQFMSSTTWVDNLKLKASYGEQGNDQVGNYYAYLDQYEVTGADGVFSDGTLTYKGNPDLTWETSVSYNVGAEFTLFNNLLSGGLEYFGRKSSDMLYYKPVAGSSGYTSIPMNIGSMTNSGLEVELTGTIVNTTDISWSVNANATFLKNKIEELHPDLSGELIDGSYIYSEGESRYRMYLVEYAGVDAETGDPLYMAINEDGEEVATRDYSTALNNKKATDDLLPAVYGGFGTTLDAYGFDFSMSFSYQLGGEIYDSGYARLMHGGNSSYAGTNWHTDIANAWTTGNTNTDVPKLNANYMYANSTSDRFLTSSNYLSLNNITFGYTLPNNLTQTMNVQSLRVFGSAENVALWSARKGLDPRQSFTVATTARYTPIRTITAGVALVF